jgi:hypothetical protein
MRTQDFEFRRGQRLQQMITRVLDRHGLSGRRAEHNQSLVTCVLARLM